MTASTLSNLNNLQHKEILIPLVVQVGLTMLVQLYLFIRRVGHCKSNNLDVKNCKTRDDANKMFGAIQVINDNFSNLCELPILYYAAILLIFVLNIYDKYFLAFAWGFTGFRILHSLIHLTYNNVEHRFAAYLIAYISCGGLWVKILQHLI